MEEGEKGRIILFFIFFPRRRRHHVSATVGRMCVRASDWGVETRWRHRPQRQMRTESRGD